MRRSSSFRRAPGASRLQLMGHRSSKSRDSVATPGRARLRNSSPGLVRVSGNKPRPQKAVTLSVPITFSQVSESGDT